MLKKIHALLNDYSDNSQNEDEFISNILKGKIEHTDTVFKEYARCFEAFHFNKEEPFREKIEKNNDIVADVNDSDIEILELLLKENYSPPVPERPKQGKQENELELFVYLFELHSHFRVACFCCRAISSWTPTPYQLILKFDLVVSKLIYRATSEIGKMLRAEELSRPFLSKLKNRKTARKMILESLKKGTKIRTSTVRSRLKKEGIVRSERAIRDYKVKVKNFLDQREAYSTHKKENERDSQKLAADYVRHIKKLEASYGQKSSSKSDDI